MIHVLDGHLKITSSVIHRTAKLSSRRRHEELLSVLVICVSKSVTLQELGSILAQPPNHFVGSSVFKNSEASTQSQGVGPEGAGQNLFRSRPLCTYVVCQHVNRQNMRCCKVFYPETLQINFYVLTTQTLFTSSFTAECFLNYTSPSSYLSSIQSEMPLCL